MRSNIVHVHRLQYVYETVLFGSKEAVDRWIELYNVIQTRCTAPTPDAVGSKRKVHRDDDPIAYSPDELIARRNAKADRVQELSIEFLARMCELVQEFATYYLHGLYHHLPDQIRSCPVDIMDASGSGIEQINQLTKRVIQYVCIHQKVYSVYYLIDVSFAVATRITVKLQLSIRQHSTAAQNRQ